MAQISKRETAESHLEHADERLKNRDYKGAMLACKEALKIEPENEKAYFKKAKALFNMNSLVDAMDDLNTAIFLKEDYVEARIFKIGKLLEYGEKEMAKQECIKLLEISPNNRTALILRVGILTSMERLGQEGDNELEKAVQALQESLLLDPNPAHENGELYSLVTVKNLIRKDKIN